MINAAQIGEGIVHKAQNSFFYVKLKEEDVIVECKLRGNSKRFRREREIVIGDRVSISLLGSRKGVIERRLPRTRFLKRPMIANITQVVLTFAAAAPDLSKVLLNRFLILAESSKIPKILIAINKSDLTTATAESLAPYETIGYDILAVSAVTGKGIGVLKARLEREMTVFAGPSGAGKSSLMNAMIPKLERKTGNVSEKIKRGRHTTRAAELIPFGTGWVVDTPGFSAVDIKDIHADTLPELFPEFHSYLGKCRFQPCSHTHEPNCAVKMAVDDGKILLERYSAYLKMLAEINVWKEKQRKREYR
mgnify:FL=1